jgi:hypothetical protein
MYGGHIVSEWFQKLEKKKKEKKNNIDLKSRSSVS